MPLNESQERNTENGQFLHSTLYSPDLAGRIVQRVGEGTQLEIIAHELGVARSTLQTWAVQHPEFGAAMQAARAEYQAHHPPPPPPSGHRAYNPEIHRTVVEAFRLGCTSDAISGIIGVSQRSINAWLDETSDLFKAELAADVARVRGEAMLYRLGIIERAAQKGTWQAAAWMLEREYPQRFALGTGRVEVTTNTTVRIEGPDKPALEEAATLVSDFRQRILAAKDVTPPPPPTIDPPTPDIVADMRRSIVPDDDPWKEQDT